MFEQNKILTVFKIYVTELFREFFKHLGIESLLHLLTGDDKCSCYTRRSQQRPLALPTVVLSESRSRLTIDYEKPKTG